MNSRIIFIQAPESLRGKPIKLYEQDEGFFINPDIPVPVELPEHLDNINTEDITSEMILSGMLRVIKAGEEKLEWIEYYREFILAMRPDIFNEFTGAAITKIINSDFQMALEILDILHGVFPEPAWQSMTIELLKSFAAETRDNGLNDEAYKKACELTEQGKAEEGLLLIHGFLERYPRSWHGWFVLGWELRLLGRWQDGIAALRKTIELGGTNGDTRNELAICLMETGDLAAAREELEAAHKDAPDNVKIISNLGILAVKDGRPGEAAAFFKTVLEHDSDDPIAKKYLAGSS
ncbi:MAG: tetratricopeptide repeat protein [Treponema sp.]|nr:tetratricopeptide repeat protein [Treponema sp.]